MKRYFLYIIICSILFITSCKEKKHPVNFYFWKTNTSIQETEKAYFEKLNCSKLYLRFFDVDIDDSGSIAPIAKINLLDSNRLQTEYIPVVFITNRTFQRLSDPEIHSLGQKINDLIEQIRMKNKLPSINEIQIDCDWTEKTRIQYFNFLSSLKDISKKNITCTLRLHQVKFKNKTGIPPVSKTYLMCYATSNPDETSDKNSILDIPLLKDYTNNINDYPLDFDVALPLYSWGIVTNHLGKIKLINGIVAQDLDTLPFRPIGKNMYEVQSDLFLDGFYLNRGFTVKVESVTPELLREAREYLNEKITKDYGIVYYHLHKPFLERFTIEELKGVGN